MHYISYILATTIKDNKLNGKAEESLPLDSPQHLLANSIILWWCNFSPRGHCRLFMFSLYFWKHHLARRQWIILVYCARDGFRLFLRIYNDPGILLDTWLAIGVVGGWMLLFGNWGFAPLLLWICHLCLYRSSSAVIRLRPNCFALSLDLYGLFVVDFSFLTTQVTFPGFISDFIHKWTLFWCFGLALWA